MVVIIVPYVLSFVTDDSEVDNVVGGDNDDNSDGLIGTTMMMIVTAVIWTTMMTVVNSLTPIDGHDHQFFNELLCSLVTSPIFVYC
jgi:hypothetical protein